MLSPAQDSPARESVSGTEVFVGGLSIKTTEESLWGYMQAFGSVRSLKIKKFNGASRGFAYIVFAAESAAARVVGTEHVLDDKKFSCTYYVPDGLAQQKVRDEKNRKLFVNCLPSKATEGDLLQYFEQFGAVERVSVNREVDGRSKKSAFVLFECEQVAKRLLRRRHAAEHKIQGKKIFFFQSLTKKEIFEFSQKRSKVLSEPLRRENTPALPSPGAENKPVHSQSTSEDQESDCNRTKRGRQTAGDPLFYNSHHIPKPQEVFKHLEPHLFADEALHHQGFPAHPLPRHYLATSSASQFEVLDSTFGHDCLANFLKQSNNSFEPHTHTSNLRFNRSNPAPYLGSRKFLAETAAQR